MQEPEGRRIVFAEGRLSNGLFWGFYEKEENKILADLLLSFDMV